MKFDLFIVTVVFAALSIPIAAGLGLGYLLQALAEGGH